MKYFKYRSFATEMLVSCKFYCCFVHKSGTHSSSEICQPFFENADTRPGQNIAQGEQVFRGKEALQ
jgi:hypothetical protein